MPSEESLIVSYLDNGSIYLFVLNILFVIYNSIDNSIQINLYSTEHRYKYCMLVTYSNNLLIYYSAHIQMMDLYRQVPVLILPQVSVIDDVSQTRIFEPVLDIYDQPYRKWRPRQSMLVWLLSRDETFHQNIFFSFSWRWVHHCRYT